jgi:hypothetical protein
MFCYGANRKSCNPVNIYLTGLGPKLLAQLSKNHVTNWMGVELHQSCYTNLPYFISSSLTQSPYSVHRSPNIADTNNVDPVTETESNSITSSTNHRIRQLVYLTSDADETLQTLDVNCAYIIGGIVDRNSLKGITRNKAIQQVILLFGIYFNNLN